MAEETESPFAWLNAFATPRPFVWQAYIYRRRLWYWFICFILLLLLVGIPLLYGIQHMPNDSTFEKLEPTQIALYLGAMVVVSYVMFVYSLFKQDDDLKWLGQRGLIAEANILAVFRSPRKLFVGYRFWDSEGREREREAVIDIDEKHPIPELIPGMVVPLLYDPNKPEHRNYLWAEISTYVTVRGS